MNKLIAFLTVFLVVLAFGVGAMLASRSALEESPIVYARATQEAAKADAEKAKADAERARAAEAWASAREADVHAAAVSQSLEQIRFGVQVLAVGLPSVMVLFAVGLAWAAVRWAWQRVNVFYPRNGVSPVLMLEHGGALFVLDPARSLGGLASIGADGRVKLPLAGSEELHAQLAAQSLAAAVIANTAGEEEKTGAAAAVGRAVQDALASLPALTQRPAVQPVFAEKKDASGELRIIRRNTPNASAPGTVKRGHMAEFVKRGSVIGFGRREWASEKFSDGTAVSQTLWAQLSKAAKDADILTQDGGRWKLRASVEDTLKALKLEEFV